MKAKRGCGLLPWLVGAISMIMLAQGLAFAADNPPTVMALSLNAGETYVINNVSPGATPQVKVITNPNALVIHNEEPGKVTLLGAAAGEWSVGVKLADGTAVDYDVTVSAVGNINNINHPGTAPAVISGSGVSVGSAAPPVATLDPGAGPVASAATSSSSSSSSTSTSGTTMTTVVGPTTVASSSVPSSSNGAPAPVAPLVVSHSTFDFYPTRSGCQLWYDSCGSGSDRIGSIVDRAISRRSVGESNRRRAALGCDYRRTALSA